MTAEKPSFIDRADRYLRREDTIPARFARKISPHEGSDYFSSWQKRWLVDVPVSVLGGIITAPLTATLCALIWKEDHGPIFYKHERMGKNGERIHVWKLRSMCLDADKFTTEEIEHINLTVGTVNDPRNTRIGRHLRRFELDELPQFWQVVRGDFSMCGIRVMHPDFRDSMARSVDTEDMVKWDAAYNRNRGIFNPNATRIKHRKDDKKRIHDDLLYDRKASLGMDYYLLIVTSLRMLEIAQRWLSENPIHPPQEV